MNFTAKISVITSLLVFCLGLQTSFSVAESNSSSVSNFSGFNFLAPPPASDYYTIGDGDILSTAIWDANSHSGPGCSCSPGCSPTSNSHLYIAHDITADCDVEIGSNSSLNVVAGGSFTILGNGSLIGTGDVTVEPGADIIIYGDLDLSGNGVFTVDGDVIVYGDVDIGNGATVCGTGNITVAGVMDGTTCFDVNVTEQVYFGITATPANAGCFVAVEEASWVSVTGDLALANNDLVRMVNTDWTQGATSLGNVQDLGYIEFSTDENSTTKALGLSNANADHNYTTIEYCFLLENNGNVSVYESGTLRTAVGTYQAGDVFKIEVVDNVVYYYQNSTLVYTSTVAPTLPLSGDASLFSVDATLSNTMISNVTDGSFAATVSGISECPPFNYQWKLNGANVGTDAASYTNSELNNGDVITCDLSSCGNVILISNTITIYDGVTTVWNGTTTDWHTRSNWTNGVPTSTRNAEIPATAATMPTISSAASCRSISIASGASLTISGTNVLTVAGNWDNQGTFTYNESTVLFESTCTEATINGGTQDFYNITVNNPDGALIQTGTVNLRGILSLENGDFNTADQLILISDASRTGAIGEITGGSITGKIEMQRYLSLSGDGFREMTSPVQGVSLADVQDDGLIMAGFPNSMFPSFGWVSVYTYRENNANGDKNNGWYTATDISNVMTPQAGHHIYIGAGTYTTKVVGEPYTGTQTFNLDYENVLPAELAADANQKGWNLIGNPYPATLDWDKVPATNKTNIENSIWIWSGTAGNYGLYVGGSGGSGTNGVSNEIASSQAIWVHGTANAPKLVVEESHKSTGDPDFVRSFQNNDFIKMRISSNVNSFYDEALLHFSDQSTANYDAGMDGLKLFSFLPEPPSISMITDGKDVSCNALPLSMAGSIPLRVKSGQGQSGIYTIDFENLAVLNGNCLYLEDLLTGIYTDLNQTSSYTFALSDTTDAPRFVLHVGLATTATVAPECDDTNDGSIILTGVGQGPFDFTWFDANGAVILNESGVATSTASNLAPGAYEVIVNGPGTSCGTQTVNIQLDPQEQVTAGINVLTVNPEEGVPTSFESNSTNAVQYTWDFGDGSAFDYTANPTHTYAQAGTYIVELQADGILCSDNITTEVVVAESDNGLVVVTSIDEETSSTFNVYTSEHNVFITLGDDALIGQPLVVYNAVGQEVYNGVMNAAQKHITLQGSGVFLVRVGESQVRRVLIAQ